MWIPYLFIAGLSLVAAVDLPPHLTDSSDPTILGSLDSANAFNTDSTENGIAKSDLSTSPPNLFGSPASSEDLKSTGNAQMSSILSNNPATLNSYNLPSSESSSNSEHPSNPDSLPSSSFSSDSDVVFNAKTLPNPLDSAVVTDTPSLSADTSDPNDPNSISPDKRLSDSTPEDPRIAQEILIPEGEVLPETGAPRGVLPNGADVTPPVPDTSGQNPSWNWIDAKPNTAADPDEAQNPPNCDKLRGNNPRIGMCCTGGAPLRQGSRTKGDLHPLKTTQRRDCILWDILEKACWWAVNRVCCFCKDVRKRAFDCYSPYFEDHEFNPNPDPPAAPQPGPPYRDMRVQALKELGIPLVGIPPLAGREKWEGQAVGPQRPYGTNRGQYGGSQAHVGSCPRDYLRSMDIVPKLPPPPPEQVIPFVRT